MEKTKQKTKRNHLPHYGRRLFGLTLGASSLGTQALLMGYLTFYLTDSAMIAAASVGGILALSRIFDGITDFFEGFIVDRTHTRWGKGRPYQLLTVVLWGAVVLLFSVPDISDIGKIIYVFIMYNLSENVARTFMTSSSTVYTKRAFTSDEQLDTIGVVGLVAGVINMAVAVITPMLISNFGQTKEGWTTIALVYAIPCAIMGLMQFFLVPEMDVEVTLAEKKEAPVSVKDSLKALLHNRFIFIFLIVSLLRMIIQGMMMSTYYFKYIVGDIGLLSVVSMVGIIAMVVMPFIPVITRKIGFKNFLSLSIFIGAVAYAMVYFAPQNLVVLSISAALTLVSGLPISMLGGVITIQCMKYTEWREGKSIDGVISSMNSVSGKVGMGLGAIIVGFMLSLGGYSGELATQPDNAISMIKFLYIGLPALLMLTAAIVMRFYTLEDKMPQIEADLEARKLKALSNNQ